MASGRLIQTALVGLDGFTALTAVGGGLALVTGLEGDRFSVRLLRGTPVRSYLVPGLILTGVVGGSAAAATVCMLGGPRLGGRASSVAGAVLMGWVVGEVSIVRAPDARSWVEVAYFGIGLLMAGLGRAAATSALTCGGEPRPLATRPRQGDSAQRHPLAVSQRVEGLLGRLDRATKGIGRSVDYTRHARYRRPPALYRRLQRLSVLLTALGLVPETVVVLEVRGRRSGKLRRTVVVRTPAQGQDYVAALAGESEWVRNIRAAAGQAVLRHGRAERVKLIEVPPDERAPILWAYLHRPGWSSPAQEAQHYFGVPSDPSMEQLRTIVDRYPVFRITPFPVEGSAREEDAHGNHQ
jgi:hypothetical protein